MNGELEMKKKAIVISFKELNKHWASGTEENNENRQDGQPPGS